MYKKDLICGHVKKKVCGTLSEKEHTMIGEKMVKTTHASRQVFHQTVSLHRSRGFYGCPRLGVGGPIGGWLRRQGAG